MAKCLPFSFLLLVAGLVGGLNVAARCAEPPRRDNQLRFVGRQAQPEAPPAIEPLPHPPAARPLPGHDAHYALAELEAMALANNPTLTQATAHVSAQRGNWQQVGLYPNPMVEYLATEVGNDGKAGQQGIYVSQEFVTVGKLKLSRQAAAQQVNQAQQQLLAQQQRVLNDVRTAYYDVLVAQRLLDATNELTRVGDEAVRATESLLKVLEVSRVDLLQAQIEADSARLQWQRAVNRHAAAWRQLTATVGLPYLQCAPLLGDIEHGLPQFEWHESLTRILSASPELAAAQAEIARANWALRRATAEPKPNIDLQAGTQYDASSQYTIQYIQTGVVVPLFNRNQGNIRKAEAEIAAARADVARLELNLQNRLATAFERYMNAKQQVELYQRRVLPNARTSLDLVAKGFKLGEVNYLTLLTSQRTFAQTQLANLEALRELRQSAVAIDGMLLTDSLASPAP